MGVVPAIYVYFQKAPVEEYEVDYYENFEGRSRQGLYEVDHIPSKAAVRIYLKKMYPDESRETIEKWLIRLQRLRFRKPYTKMQRDLRWAK